MQLFFVSVFLYVGWIFVTCSGKLNQLTTKKERKKKRSISWWTYHAWASSATSLFAARSQAAVPSCNPSQPGEREESPSQWTGTDTDRRGRGKRRQKRGVVSTFFCTTTAHCTHAHSRTHRTCTLLFHTTAQTIWRTKYRAPVPRYAQAKKKKGVCFYLDVPPTHTRYTLHTDGRADYAV